MAKQQKVIDPLTSKRSGLSGAFEVLLRRFKALIHMSLIVPFYVICSGIVGLAITPGVLLVWWVAGLVRNLHLEAVMGLWGELLVRFLQGWAIASAVAGAVVLAGLGLVLILPLANFIILWGGTLKSWRGPYYSLEAIRWYIHNGITYILRYTLLEMFTPTPIGLLFYRLMRMKIGQGSIINSTAISDPSLITIGRKVTIGGSVTIVGHYGQAGFLVLSPVVIGDGATIGLKASIMGGVKIGKNARVMPHSVVLPKTVIPDDEVWGGVPAVKLS